MPHDLRGESKYLDYLPAIYSDRRESGPELGRLLLPFEAQLEGLRDLLAEVDRFFAPELAPTPDKPPSDVPDFLSWLADWVALALDESWDEEKRRKILRQAVTLYKLRGTRAGLKQFLEIYTEQRPEISDGRWPGGFQIGLSSRLPVVKPAGALSMDERGARELRKMERRYPPVYRDYYVVRTRVPNVPPWSLPTGHPLRAHLERLGPDAAARVGEVFEVSYAADDVVSVKLAPAGNEPAVTLELAAGGEHEYHPASIARQDKVIDELYELEVDGQQLNYRGDGFLIDSLEMPHRFTVDFAMRFEGWVPRFEAFPLAFVEKPPRADLPEEERPKARAEFLARLRAAQAEQQGLAEEAIRLWRAGKISEPLDKAFERKNIKRPVNVVTASPGLGDPAALGGQAIDPARRSFALARKGDALWVFEWMGGASKWEEASKPDRIRRIRAIVDEVKPAHTVYFLRMAGEPARRGVPSSRIEADFRIGVESVVG